MAVTTTGVEFKKFYADKAVWPRGAWFEDTSIRVDNEYADDDFDLRAIPADAAVVVDGGWIYREGKALAARPPYWCKGVAELDFETALKKWLALRTHTQFVVHVPNDQAEKFRLVMAENGWM
jgi:hypothetical protein